MPKTVLWLIISFTILFSIAINTGDPTYQVNLGTTICLSGIGVG
jgi:hypothetical protein